MPTGQKAKPCEILKPTLEAMDHLRIGLDCAIEEENELAAKALLRTIRELATAAEEIQAGTTKKVAND